MIFLKEMIRKEFKSKNTHKFSNINNTILNTDKYLYSNLNQISLVNNIEIDNQIYTMEDHA